MAILTTNQKIKVLMAIVMRIYNPDVMYTYTGKGDSEDEAASLTKKTLRENLTVKPDDTIALASFKMFIYYFVCGRFIPAASPLTYFPVFKNRTRTHLKVFLKPVQKGKMIIRRDGKMGYAPHSDFTIPNYIGGERPTIPQYTYGGWTVTLSFTDQSSIQLRTLTREEGVTIVLGLGNYVDKKYHPVGGLIEKNLRISEPNQGKKNNLHGIKLKPLKVEFYKYGKSEWEWARNVN